VTGRSTPKEQNMKDRTLKTDDIYGAAPKIHGGVDNIQGQFAGVRAMGFMYNSQKTKSSVFGETESNYQSRDFLHGAYRGRHEQTEVSSKVGSDFGKYDANMRPTELDPVAAINGAHVEKQSRNYLNRGPQDDSLDREMGTLE